MLKVSNINDSFLNDLVNDTQALKPLKDKQEDELLGLLEQCLINPDDEIKPPEHLTYIGNAPLYSLGDFSLTIGKAKSKKTRFTAWTAADVMQKGIKVVWFDTEQSRGHAQSILRNIINASGNNIEFYCLRPYSVEERKKIINARLQSIKEKSLVVIDGIRDLVTDINDPTQANDCATWLMKVTEEKYIHIINILHQNKGDANARGHLGTELTNKATTVISVEKDKNNPEYSTVTAEYSRDIPFEPFMFKINDDGNIDIEDNLINTEIKKTVNPFDIELSIHREIARDVFEEEQELTYNDLLEKIRYNYTKVFSSVGVSKGKQLLTHLREQKIISIKEKRGKNVIYQYAV